VIWVAREYDPARTPPGDRLRVLAAEWSLRGEGYGWGAFTTHLLLRPDLPLEWRQAGRQHTLHWHSRGRPLAIVLKPLPLARVRVTVNGANREVGWGEELAYRDGVLRFY
jgi:hypothetical protein